MKTPKLLPTALLAGVACLPAAGSVFAPDLSWMSGHWCVEREGELVEEYWLPQRSVGDGQLLQGLARTTKKGAVTSFEFLRIEVKDLRPTLVAQPGGAPPTEFPATEWGQGFARFANPRHDYPTRIEYRRAGAGLRAEVGGGEEGRQDVIVFDYRPCAKS